MNWISTIGLCILWPFVAVMRLASVVKAWLTGGGRDNRDRRD